MKYIRTKDGRILKLKIGEQTDISYDKEAFEVYNKAGIVAPYEPIEVLKQADSLKELCDKWVAVINGKPHVLAYECDLLDKINNNKKLGIETIGFGAIWVKGERDEPILKPVAKMNDEGKLKLL